MTEQDSTKLLFLLEQYRPDPVAVKASESEMTNLPSNMYTPDMISITSRYMLLVKRRVSGLPQLKTNPHCG